MYKFELEPYSIISSIYIEKYVSGLSEVFKPANHQKHWVRISKPLTRKSNKLF
jgi:hypothetical protein